MSGSCSILSTTWLPPFLLESAFLKVATPPPLTASSSFLAFRNFLYRKMIAMAKMMVTDPKPRCSILKLMSPMSAEATVVRNYIDWMLSLPWGETADENLELGYAVDPIEREARRKQAEATLLRKASWYAGKYAEKNVSILIAVVVIIIIFVLAIVMHHGRDSSNKPK